MVKKKRTKVELRKDLVKVGIRIAKLQKLEYKILKQLTER